MRLHRQAHHSPSYTPTHLHPHQCSYSHTTIKKITPTHKAPPATSSVVWLQWGTGHYYSHPPDLLTPMGICLGKGTPTHTQGSTVVGLLRSGPTYLCYLAPGGARAGLLHCSLVKHCLRSGLPLWLSLAWKTLMTPGGVGWSMAIDCLHSLLFCEESSR